MAIDLSKISGLNKILDNPYAVKVSSLSNLVDLASTAGEMYLVAPEEIESEVYIFDTRSDESVELQSDITDNWVEDNTTRQDHIALKPIQFTLTGYVGELTNKLPTEFSELQKYDIPAKTSSLSPFLPNLTTQAQYVFNRTEELYKIYEKANRTASRLDQWFRDGQTLPVPITATKQAQVFAKFYELWATRQLVSVYTPFGVYNSMAILSVHATQEEETKSISKFEVTFKEVRAAGMLIDTEDEKKFAGRTAAQMSKQVDKGTSKGTTVAKSITNWIGITKKGSGVRNANTR